MGKVITSPVKKFPGTVTLSDPLTFPQFIAYKRAIEAAQAHQDDPSEFDRALLPGLIACVEEWKLNGGQPYTAETFPATPRRSSARLVSWLLREINALVMEAEDDPNA